MTAYLVTPIVVFTLMATATAACSTPAGTAAGTAGTGEGSAMARDTTRPAGSTTPAMKAKDAKDDHANLPKGELMGTGVGAAAGALYDVKKRRTE